MDASSFLTNRSTCLQIRPWFFISKRVSSPSDSARVSALSWLASHATETDALPRDLADRHDYYLYQHGEDQPL
jgi:hypothetical protein